VESLKIRTGIGALGCYLRPTLDELGVGAPEVLVNNGI